MFINGQLFASGGTLWLPGFQWDSLASIQLFSAFTDVAPWPGELFLFSVYPSVLTSSQINTNFNAGIPNSLPVALNSTVSVKENGENATSHYSDPAFYLGPVPSAYLQSVLLQAYDLDEQSFCSIACSSRTPNSYMTMRISSLPSLGTLYLADGSTASIASVIPRDASGQYAVRYRPPWNQVSSKPTTPLDSFSFLAIDGSSLLPSTYQGSVSIVVTRVIKPPVVNNVNLTLVANVIRIIRLTAYPDSNGNGTIRSFSIVSLPLSGSLFQVYSNGTVARSPITTPGNLLSQQVAYLYGYEITDCIF